MIKIKKITFKLKLIMLNSVAMMTTKFVWSKFNRAIQEELIATKFVYFRESLVIALLRYNKTCKNICISYRNNDNFIFCAGNTSLLAPFHYLIRPVRRDFKGGF